MKTLYVRFVVTATIIIVTSSLLAFFIANAYYQIYLKPFNDQKITKIASEAAGFAASTPNLNMDDYLNTVAQMGYQIYLKDEQGRELYFGRSFKKKNVGRDAVSSVLEGEVYHGIANFPKKVFITGFFDNELRNTVGVPFQSEGKRYALFIRPDIQLQFGEMRIFFAQLLAFSIGLTMLFIFISTRYVVKPIRNLTKATKKIAEGQYNIQLDVERKDEIGLLAQSFTRMAASLKRLDEMRQEFVSNVSHEIQSPLTSIQGFSQALRTEQVTEEQRQQYLSIIEEESRRLSMMSKQLLMLASLDKEHDILELTTFDAAEQLKQIFLTTAWYWREKELAIDMNLPSISINGDKRFLHQVWMNLVYNSIKFTDPGGTIFVSAYLDDNSAVHVIIEDTGKGIDEEDLPYIFDRYYKGDKARKREESGSGLGLSIVKKIVELHKGTVTVQSEAGVGTRFEIILPQ
ncbi:sensor histidine kinase [Priestia abyssalis]|uniref:sensor histidine kinase n=1 Tax=Priestia abyssalis TaxID=1221450 RepID=UPI000995AA4F|nr:HAMP domain-containing sensor histidine kinase [Priestia abyssalis]